jgi:hypothetical protein
MDRFSKMFRLAQVWLTALMTLFAGFPQWTCACPEGKPAIASHSKDLAKMGCGCGRNCCSGASPKNCCSSHQAKTEPSINDHFRIQNDDRAQTGEPGKKLIPDRQCCIINVVRAENSCLPSGKTTFKKALTPDFVFSPATLTTPTLQAPDLGGMACHTYGSAPPTDLITLLLHLLI